MRPAVLILAGGEGRRMGGGKPLRMLGGRSLLDRAIDRARGWSDRIAIAARDAEQVGEADIEVLIDPPGMEGPLGGLASAGRLGRPLVLTIPCDMPFLPDDLLERLAAALGEHKAALAMSEGQVHPVCGLWRADALARLGDYAASGRRSLIGFAEAIGYVGVGWEGDPFFNVNSAGDLDAAEASLAERPAASKG